MADMYPYRFALGAFVAGAALATAVCLVVWPKDTVDYLPLRQSNVNPENAYRFIDPLLGLHNVNEEVSDDFASLESTIRTYLQTQERAGAITTASVKIRDLQTSTGFTVNPDQQYAPASLLKVPIMMTYFKLAEEDDGLLSQRITYRSEVQPGGKVPKVPPKESVVPGTTYTVAELIRRMIQHSDNGALTLLENYLQKIKEPSALDTLARDLGIDNVHVRDDFITIQGYGLFWRVLYNATYLSRDMSERALEILSRTSYTGGIKSGVPDSVVVAQKFGEYGFGDIVTKEVIKQELHDCGIVYYPEHPYLLCIMTKGMDIDALDSVIREISRLTYEDRERVY